MKSERQKRNEKEEERRRQLMELDTEKNVSLTKKERKCNAPKN